MHITINGSGDTEIVEEFRNGDRWLVAKDVPIVQPQVLAKGYVPEQSVKASLDQENTHGGQGWDGVPATLNHPRNLPEFSWHDPRRPTGEPVLAANDDVQETLGLGELEDPSWDGQFIRVDVAVNADRAEEMGGEATDVVEALENDEPLDVSTQYIGAPLPPGEYDGRHRDRAEAIVAPDGLALLPNAPGQCSVEDGCGVNPVSAPIATANGVSITVNSGHAPPITDAEEPTVNTTDDPVWSGLGGTLRRIAEDVNAMRDRGLVNDGGLLDQLAVDVKAAIGMWRSHDETMGGDGELPGPLSRDEEGALLSANAEELSRRALVQAALTSNQFPGEFPFVKKSECIAEMEGEVDDPGAFCNAWHQGSALAANSGAEAANADQDQSANEPAESGVDHDTSNDAMKITVNQDARLDAWAELVSQVSGADIPLDMLDLFNVHMIAADAIRGASIDDVASLVSDDELAEGIDEAELRDRIDTLREEVTDTTLTINMDRDDLIDEITANSNIKRESLEGMGDTCLQTTYEHIAANDGGSDDDPEAGDDVDDDVDGDDVDDDVDADGDTIVTTREELESIIDERVEDRVTANEQQRTKEKRVERIVANSAEYGRDDEEELMETPDSVLDRIEQGLTSTFQMAATTGATPTANAGEGSDEVPDDVDLGTGVMGE